MPKYVVAYKEEGERVMIHQLSAASEVEAAVSVCDQHDAFDDCEDREAATADMESLQEFLEEIGDELEIEAAQ